MNAAMYLLSRMMPLQRILYSIATVDSFEKPSAAKDKQELLTTN
jgi:hypothetical protein